MKSSATYLLDAEDREQVESLRFATLVNEGSFIADPSAVKWNDSDEKSKVFGIYSEHGLLLSTMRAERIHTAEELVPKLDYEHLHKIIALPCGLLGKASTHKDYQGHGFNTYLRYLAYRDFYEDGYRFIVGTVMPNAHRVGQLRELGYQFLENPEGWRRYGYNSFGKTLVCYLDLEKNFRHVMKLLEPKVKRLQEKFPYVKV